VHGEHTGCVGAAAAPCWSAVTDWAGLAPALWATPPRPARPLASSWARPSSRREPFAWEASPFRDASWAARARLLLWVDRDYSSRALLPPRQGRAPRRPKRWRAHSHVTHTETREAAIQVSIVCLHPRPAVRERSPSKKGCGCFIIMAGWGRLWPGAASALQSAPGTTR
jgi:hypothetical protein